MRRVVRPVALWVVMGRMGVASFAHLETLYLGALAEGAVAEGTPYLTLSTVARYWFYPGIFRDVPGQGAYQAVWLAPVRREDCAVCGSPAGRVDPLEVPLRAPSREALAALLDAEPDPT